MLEKFNLLSVNQLAASIKLTEACKSINIRDYPLQLEKNNSNAQPSTRSIRPTTARAWNEDARSEASKDSFSRNAAKLWNAAPKSVKEANTFLSAKRAIKIFTKTLPI